MSILPLGVGTCFSNSWAHLLSSHWLYSSQQVEKCLLRQLKNPLAISTFHRLARTFCLYISVLHATMQYSLTRLVHKFGAYSVSRDWHNSALSRAMNLGVDKEVLHSRHGQRSTSVFSSLYFKIDFIKHQLSS